MAFALLGVASSEDAASILFAPFLDDAHSCMERVVFKLHFHMSRCVFSGYGDLGIVQGA